MILLVELEMHQESVLLQLGDRFRGVFLVDSSDTSEVLTRLPS
jgi:hypothetical protein